MEIEQQVAKDVKFDSLSIKLFIKSYLDKTENTINSIQTNQIFIDYLIDPSAQNKQTAINLFTGLIKSDENLFQLRFIDKDGLEKIRIEKQRNSKIIFSVEENQLQNKSSRYYFEETVKNKVGDLQRLLSQIGSNNSFSIYLLDGNGNFILNPVQEKSWNSYLNNGHTLFSEFTNLDENSLITNDFGENRYVFDLENYFKNNENIKLLLEADNSYLRDIKENNLHYIYVLGSVVLIISLLVGFLISIPASKLYLSFNKLYKDNLRFIDIIDENVITTTVDLDKKITSVSSAMCKLSCYKKGELIGKTPAIFKSYDTNNEVYKTLWNKISSGIIWSGELRNKAKDGSYYWLKTTILPNFDGHKNIQSYTSISQDTTDKKIIEKLSQTDKLTQLYNRTKLDEHLEDEFNRYKRGKYAFCVMLIDIDKFKDVNDTHGHQVGDRVLVEMANILKENCRKTDIAGRWGGEEFMLICSNTELDGAVAYAQNIRQRVEKFNFSVVGHITISVGLAQINEDDSIETIIQKADKNLYRAKENGRNRVEANKFN